MLVQAATNSISLERALRGDARNAPLTPSIPLGRPSKGGAVARPLDSSFTHAANSGTLLAAQELRENPASRQGVMKGPKELSPVEELKVSRMVARDAEVRRHELAHASSGGAHIGVAEYKYERGPDGKLYAVGGRVSIDVAPAGSASATIRKMEAVIRAAMAPANPSMADRAAAVLAWQIRQMAVNEEMAEEKSKEEKAEELKAEHEPTSPIASFTLKDGGLNAGSIGVTFAAAATYERAAGQTQDSRQKFDLNT
jgi:hypothetical protein